MGSILLDNALIVTGKKCALGSLLIEDERIAGLVYADEEGRAEKFSAFLKLKPEIMDLGGKMLFAGGIDAHVHFREPGLTHKADMGSESEAAIYGGVCSFIDMPNTKPVTTSMTALREKLEIAAEKSHANYAFHLGATNDNLQEICSACENNAGEFAGIKVFMGSSTGNMLVDDEKSLEALFSIKNKTILVHCEDEQTIKDNLARILAEKGEDIAFGQHPEIRSRQACIKSSIKALELAMKHGTRLHLLHISTKEEVEMLRAAKAINPLISGETSANYLWFCDEDYARLGSRLKCNPAVKTAEDRNALIQAVKDGIIDTIGSDHAPHTKEEKEGGYTKVPSGLPSIQQAFAVLLSIAEKNEIPFERVASAFSEKSAEIFGIEERGCIKLGNYADLVVVDRQEHRIDESELRYRCGWSPYTGEKVSYVIDTVFLNGKKFVPDTEKNGQKHFGKALKFKSFN